MAGDDLKTKRGIIKTKITRFRKFLEDPANKDKHYQIRARLTGHELLWSEYGHIQDQIEVSIQAGDRDAIAKESDERDSFESDYYELVGLAEELIANTNNGNKSGQGINVAAQPNTQSNNVSMLKQLPQISLPKFNGDLSKWINFRDSFDSLVNSQALLSKIDKFNYLNNALEGEAARAIQSLGISETNYDHAWKKLRDRYENSEELILHHTRALFGLAPMTKNSYTDLRRLIDDAHNHLIALRSMGQAIGTWDSLLIHLIYKKVDDEARSSWNKRTLTTLGKRTFDDFTSTLETHCKYLQTDYIEKRSIALNQREQASHRGGKGTNERAVLLTTTMNSCPKCKGNHPIYMCKKFREREVQERIERIKELKLCFNCLRSDHQSKPCLAGTCKKCSRRHNTLLHVNKPNSELKDTSNEPTMTSERPNNSTVLTVQSSDNSSTHVILGTAIVQVHDHEGVIHECRALLDSGSQIHFITQELCNKLRLFKTSTDTTISGIHQATINLNYKALLKLQSRTTSFKTTITCLITPKITDNLPNSEINRRSIKIPSGIELADPLFDDSRPIDLLIGAGLFWDLLCVGQIKTGRDQPLLQKTKLGWIVTASIPQQSQSLRDRAACHMITNAQLHQQVERFWAVEECTQRSGAPPLNPFDPCEQLFRSSTSQDSNGRFIVNLPFNDKKDQLGESYHIAVKRLMSMERKFKSNAALHVEYVKFMKEYEELGHMSRLSQTRVEEVSHAFYLPHHAVIKEQSTTTKLRVVFDGSAMSTSGLSLNDVQHAGYEVQDELFSILLRFRKHKYIVADDAKQMYRQIWVKEQDRAYQRILWRPNDTLPIEVFELNTVTYGTRPGAYLAKRCLRQIGEENKEVHPDACEVIINDFYLDDLLTGANSVDAAKELSQGLTQLLRTRGFELRKWASNDARILKDISTDERVIEPNKDPKTLGLKWKTSTDELLITISPQEERKITKRSILSQIAQIFDPLGIIAPITVQGKIILQRIWQLQLEWDESLPQDLYTIWKEFQQGLIHLYSIQIPRRVLGDQTIRVELHGFSDASERAFGACIYLRSTDKEQKHTVRLLCAKSRVAPLKKMSIPRLELSASLLLSQLVSKTTQALKTKIEDQYFWSDSMIALAWIKGQSNRWKNFVANRIGEIQRLTNNNWAHVTSENNPADLVSRGADPIQLSNSALWWHGPWWLSQDNTSWPCKDIQVEDDASEERHVVPMIALTNVIHPFNSFNKFSSWPRLVRVLAYCLRFIHTTRNKDKDIKSSALSTYEIQRAQRCIIKIAQQEWFSEELKRLKAVQPVAKSSRLSSLNPFIDTNGILRVGGRLQKAPIEFDHKHPIILPPNHRLTWLIIEYEHKRLLHAGYQAVISSLRTRYWPLSAKMMVRKIVKKCVTCIRLQGTTTQYIMGNLPSSRITPTRPFLISGVDYAGPLYLKERGRSRVTIKAYMCIFICFTTKAVHIELAHDLTTDAFLNCLRRFISRRGRCQRLYSDNGLNFVGAHNQLNELGALLQSKGFRDKVGEYTTNEQIVWHLNPSYSPHFGGLWESAVKSTKFHLKRVVGETRLTYEETYTILTQIEACLNSRPLSPLSDDPNDLTPLTPAHFLIGESLTALPEANVSEIPINRLDRYQHLQYMVQHFWRRWQQEYLHQLQQRNKWTHGSPCQLKPGSMVIIKDDNSPPTRWRLGRITQLHMGTDSIARVVSLRTSDGIITRPVVKLIPLLIDPEDSSSKVTRSITAASSEQ
ncbi:uncharacterized protein [Euwallacea similis]|uniref:uncharacterized protein n=1 Tax=Euwallacea similis TaxID=1736056 RepID=UPI00344D3088